jgi:hypothetical protein
MNEWIAKCRLIYYSNTFIPGSFDRNAIEWGPSADFNQLSFEKVTDLYPTVPNVDVEIGGNYFGEPGAFDGIKFLLLLRTDGAYQTPFTTALNQTFVHSLISFHAQLQNQHISLLRTHQFCFPNLEHYFTYQALGNLQEIVDNQLKEEYLACFIQILLSSVMSVFLAFRQNVILSGNYQLVRYRFVSPSLAWTEAGLEQEIDFYTDFFQFNEADPFNFEPLFAYLDFHQEEYNFPNLYQVFDSFVIMNVETYMEPREPQRLPQPRRVYNPPMNSIIRTRAQARNELPVSAFTRARVAAASYRQGWKVNKTNSMFFRDPLHYFFQESHCIVKVPDSEERCCFAMAFLKAQIRIHEKDPEGNIHNIIEVAGNASCKVFSRQKYAISIPCKDLNYNRKKGEFYDGQYIWIGNTWLREGIEADDELIWKSAGQKIHVYVETQVGYLVDKTNLLETAQAYANVFQIYVHIYRFVKVLVILLKLSYCVLFIGMSFEVQDCLCFHQKKKWIKGMYVMYICLWKVNICMRLQMCVDL